MKHLLACALLCVPQLAIAQELKLPPGFTATLVTDGLVNARHMAIRGNDIYVSTNHTNADPGPQAIHAIRLGPDHKPVQVTTLGTVWGGTGIRVHDGALYAANATTVWRYVLDDGLVPKAAPQAIVEGMQNRNNRNRILEFDESGMTAFRWSPQHKALFGILHDRDNGASVWPQYFTLAQELAVGDGLYRIGRGTDFGWPYSYYDGVRNLRLQAPEYGGDGRKLADRKADTPVLSMVSEPTKAAPVDMVFYNATQFPAA
jgi:glucose/arabinose dehydrogenase